MPNTVINPPGAEGDLPSAALTTRRICGGATAAAYVQGSTVNPEVVRLMIAVWSGRGAMLRVNACETGVVTDPVLELELQVVEVVPLAVLTMQVSVVVEISEPVIHVVVLIVVLPVVVVVVVQLVPVWAVVVVPRIGASTI